jgi:hypothetical protein
MPHLGKERASFVYFDAQKSRQAFPKFPFDDSVPKLSQLLSSSELKIG